MKILKAVVKVVAIVATIASFIPGPWQPVAAIVAKVAMVASAALEIVSPTKARPPTARGSPTQYQLDPNIGIPYMVGRTQFAGCGVKRETWGTDNQYQCFTSVYSLGPINAIETFTADKAAINFDGAGAATTASVAGFMWFVAQLGLCPSPVLASPVAGLPGWTSSSKMSGLAASHWVLKFDKKGKKFTSGPPQPGIVAQAVKVYDPRKDSTFPGGVGACRAGDESTYVYSETPHLHALTYALGRYQNGKRRLGIGFPAAAIDMVYFANAANVDEANNWKIGGVVYSTDSKWNTLKMMMEAGGGAPITTGGKLTGIQRAPKAAIATITGDEIVGASSIVATQTIRDRINVGTPRYRSEAHGWEYVSGDPCRVASYVALDGGDRNREYEWTLVQQVKQASQLTFYEIYDARELGPIELRLKIRWVGLKAGDCVNLNIPDMNLNNQKCVVLSRSFDPQTGSVMLRFRTETDQKHTDALAANGSAPPVQSLSFDPDFTPPAPTGWTIGSGGLATSGGTVPTLRFSGGPAALNADAVEFLYRKSSDTDWSAGGRGSPDTVRFDVSSVAPGTAYMGRVQYIVNGKASAPLDLGPFTVESLTASGATIANSIVGQGSLATLNSLAYGGAYLTGFGTLAARADVRFGNEVKRANGTTIVADADAITSLGTAAGFVGQGALATRSNVNVTQVPLFEGANLIVDNTYSGWTENWGAYQMDGATVPTLANTSDPEVVALNVTKATKYVGAGSAMNSRSRVGYAILFPAKAGDVLRMKAQVRLKAGFNGRVDLASTIYNSAGGFLTSRTVSSVDYRASPLAADTNISLSALAAPLAVLPAGAASMDFITQVLWSNTLAPAGTAYIALPEVRPMQKLGDMVAREDGVSVLTDAVAVTSLGTSAGFIGQGSLATLNSLAYGGAYLTGFGTLAARSNARIGTELVRADGSTATSEAMLITSLGTASAVVGQTAWATEATLTPTIVQGRTQRHDNTTGRITSAAGYRSNRSYGLRSVFSGITFTDTWVGAGNVTINIPASTLTADDGTTLSLPSGSLTNCASATKFYIYRTLADPLSSTGSYGKSTTLEGACSGDNAYLGNWTTRATSGGTGGGGGFGDPNCVAGNAFVPTSIGDVLAELIEAGQPIKCLDERHRMGPEWVEVLKNHPAMSPCVTLVTESGIKLTLAESTPLTREDLSTVLAPNGKGIRIPVEDKDGFRWEEITDVFYSGHREVAHISVGGRTYAAGDEPGRYAYTHNTVKF